MKFIHTADIHLDSPLHRLERYEGAPVEEIRQASRRAFENLMELAMDEAVDFLLIAGDLFDGDWRDYNTGLYFVNQVRRLNENRIRVFLISGNHDASGKMTRSLPYPDNVHVLSPKTPETIVIEELKLAVHGQGFAKVAVTENQAAAYPEPLAGYFNIGMLHTSLTGRQGHATYSPCSLDDLVNRGYDYWALGHVHQFEMVEREPPVVFSGCIQGRHIRESGCKGCVLVSVEDGMHPDVTFHDVDVIRWERVTVDLDGVADIHGLLEKSRAVLERVVELHDPKPVVVRATFNGETDLHNRMAADPQEIKESLRSTAIANFGDRVWIEKVVVRTRPKKGAVTDPGPFRELNQLVDDLVADETGLLNLGKELAHLFQKLPPEYRQGDAKLRPDNPEQMRELVTQAHSLLKQSLKKEGAS